MTTEFNASTQAQCTAINAATKSTWETRLRNPIAGTLDAGPDLISSHIHLHRGGRPKAKVFMSDQK